ncbi:MAG: transketolase [Rhodospirillaceae bacterium]|nr:transketolase [Rhodospirillaceae bacterium]
MSDVSDSMPHDRMANAIRALSMDAVQAANSGHPGMPMGLADVATVLFTRFLKYDPLRPNWPDRDRFVLSAGHGSMLLYSLLHLTGYPDMTMDEIKNFRKLHSRTPGHPEHGTATGVETTTGPLGQGLATAVGMAIAERMMNARCGDDLVDHRTWVAVGDGCLMEGVSQEAITLAGHLKLSKLIVLFDDNETSIDGPISLTTSDNQTKRFEACGWHVQKIDGHDPVAIAAAMQAACDNDLPSMIACRTIIGFGAPTKAGTAATHGAPLGDEEVAGTRAALGWEYPPFVLPDNVVNAWREAGARGAIAVDDWETRLAAAAPAVRAQFNRVVNGDLPVGLGTAILALKKGFVDDLQKLATRQASGKVLDRLTQVVPEMVGGSADLTGSNNTRAAGHTDVVSDDFSGAYLRYGVREQGMAAAMNGIALHGGLIPYSGTFLVFADYARPAIRLSALMKQRVVYVMTHDSIGLGEDGPTHQPVEHLASLRAMPNLNVFRPCDAVEVAECWELALRAEDTPSVMVLTRQGLPALRDTHWEENACTRGAYILSDVDGQRDVTLLASGSEMSIAIEAQTLLQEEGILAAVVSIPCWEMFERQSNHYQDVVLGGVPCVACEAAVDFGWERWTGNRRDFIGMHGFGASAPGEDLYEHFGITVAAIVEAARKILADA